MASPESIQVISGILINTVAFVKATDFLFLLSHLVLGSETLAFKAALAFCLSPASIFFVAIYTEALFSCFFFGALWYLKKRGKPGAATAVLFFLASATRSNGVVCLGFVIFSAVSTVVSKVCQEVKEKPAREKKVPNLNDDLSCHQMYQGNIACKERRRTSHLSAVFSGLKTLSRRPYAVDVLLFATNCVACCLPLVLFQLYIRFKLCGDPGDPNRDSLDWCKYNGGLLGGFSYSHVQAKFWNVGFMKYWAAPNYPQWIMVAPVISESLMNLHTGVKAHPFFLHCLWLLLPFRFSYTVFPSLRLCLAQLATLHYDRWGFLVGWIIRIAEQLFSFFLTNTASVVFSPRGLRVPCSCRIPTSVWSS